jgi:hypothetical protein
VLDFLFGAAAWLYDEVILIWDKISLFHNEILAIATIFIAAFTIILACVARRQIKDTRILQRAYIVAEPYGIDTFTDGKRVVGYTGIRNAGRLPATELR